MTTGPLGQGCRQRGRHGAVGPPRARPARPGRRPRRRASFDHDVYVIACDGDLQEGVSAEASSIAGTQQLGNLTVIYDRNRISIEGDTDIAFTEDVAARYEAYGWHVQTVDWTNGGTEYVEDVPALYDAIRKAEAVTDQPVADRARHRHRAGPPRTRRAPRPPTAARSAPTRSRPPRRCSASTPSRPSRCRPASSSAPASCASAAPPGRRVGRAVRRVGRGPPGVGHAAPAPRAPRDARRPRRRAADLRGRRKGVATRSASGKVINALAPVLPELLGRLGRPRRLQQHHHHRRPVGRPRGRRGRRVEHRPLRRPRPALRHPRARHGRDRERHRGLHGLIRVFGGTFLTFSDYMRGVDPRWRRS